MGRTRYNGRSSKSLRPIKITRNYLKHPEGSALIEMGETKVICTASIEERVPNWMKNQGVPGGWVTAEYGMLPRSTNTRVTREGNRTSGRTMEIQRLIGRSLRAIVDLVALGERTIWIDCDVIQADGGTRTAAISGSFAALHDAIQKLELEGKLSTSPIRDFVAAVSVGIVGKELLLDLDYEEDSNAEVDMNVVMTGTGEFVELQATGERGTMSSAQLNDLIALGKSGIESIIAMQKETLAKKLTV